MSRVLICCDALTQGVAAIISRGKERVPLEFLLPLGQYAVRHGVIEPEDYALNEPGHITVRKVASGMPSSGLVERAGRLVSCGRSGVGGGWRRNGHGGLRFNGGQTATTANPILHRLNAEHCLRERGLPCPHAEGHAHAPRNRCGLKVRAPGNAQPRALPPGTRASKPARRRAGACAAASATHPLRTKSPRSRKCPAASTAFGNAGFQARTPKGRRMRRALRPALAAD